MTAYPVVSHAVHRSAASFWRSALESIRPRSSLRLECSHQDRPNVYNAARTMGIKISSWTEGNRVIVQRLS